MPEQLQKLQMCFEFNKIVGFHSCNCIELMKRYFKFTKCLSKKTREYGLGEIIGWYGSLFDTAVTESGINYVVFL